MDYAATSLESEAHRRHEAMLERLAARAAARAAASDPSSTAVPASPTFESVESFLARFNAAKQSIESQISRLRSSPLPTSDPKSDVETLVAAVADLDRLVADNSYFLPSYDLRSSLNSISDIKQTIDSLSSSILPKKKFSFRKNKSASTGVPKSSSAPDQAAEIEESSSANSNPTMNQTIVCDHESPGFRKRSDSVLVKKFKPTEEREGDFTLFDLDSCEVCLKGKIRALYIYKLLNCRVFVGPVIGSIHVEEVEDCLFMAASHQIRIHNAKNSDFYLRVRSRPIIEDCNNVRFAPYKLFYQGINDELKEAGLGEENGNWANVDDFKWLKAVQSPNWCLLPEDKQYDTWDVTDLEED